MAAEKLSRHNSAVSVFFFVTKFFLVESRRHKVAAEKYSPRNTAAMVFFLFPIFSPRDVTTPTYQRCSNRIDVIIMSNLALRAVKSMCTLPYDYLTFSDHKAVCVDLDVSMLFGSRLDVVTIPTARTLNTKCPQKMQLYEDRLLHEFKSHCIEEKKYNTTKHVY